MLAVLAMCGCSSAPTKVELPVLASYQSVESYGSVALEAEGTLSGSANVKEFLAAAQDYALARGIEVKGSGTEPPADSRIVVSSGYDGAYLASLYRSAVQIDELRLAGLSEVEAQKAIDEMLLLWHPPDLGRKPRGPVPEFALLPTSYAVKKDSFFALMKDDVEHMNIGHQSWHQFQSRTPTFSWEDFPREWDVASGMSRDDFRNVRYEFRIYPAQPTGMGYRAPASAKEEASGLSEPHYTLKENLDFCREYLWTVRAVFELNGVPRQTEWAGAFSLYKSMQDKPWFIRRNLRRTLAARFDPSSYFFTVRSPKNPFAEACVYH